MKICGDCKESKPLSEFNRKGERYQSRCRDCQKTWYSNYYANSPKEKERLERKRKKDYADFRVALDELKNVPCMDCAEDFPPYVMDFDHLGDKEFNISQMFGKPWLSVLSEIGKCDIVCANCHRKRTHERKVLLTGQIGKVT